MKMLQGSLKETQYHWPNNNNKRNVPLDEKYATHHHTDDVTYINGEVLFNDHLFTKTTLSIMYLTIVLVAIQMWPYSINEDEECFLGLYIVAETWFSVLHYYLKDLVAIVTPE